MVTNKELDKLDERTWPTGPFRQGTRARPVCLLTRFGSLPYLGLPRHKGSNCEPLWPSTTVVPNVCGMTMVDRNVPLEASGMTTGYIGRDRQNGGTAVDAAFHVMLTPLEANIDLP